MNWLEKVRHLKNIQDKGIYTIEGHWIDISTEENLWEEGELESLIKNYTYLPESYISFIKEFDNLGLAHVVFYGSKAGNINPLQEALKYWKQNLGKSYFPFAKAADGSAYTINKKGEITRFQLHATEDEVPIKFAESFEEFVGECILGKKYPGYDDPDREEDNFYLILKHLNWV